MKDKDKLLKKVTGLMIIFLLGIVVGMHIIEPIAHESGKIEQQAFDAGAYDAFALYWYNYSNGILDLRYYNWVPTEELMRNESMHPYIKGWAHYNETKELRPNIVPVFGIFKP